MHSQLLLLKIVGLNAINENDSKDIKVVHENGQDSRNQCHQQVKVQISLNPHKEVVHEGDQCDYQSSKTRTDSGSTVNLSMEV